MSEETNEPVAEAAAVEAPVYYDAEGKVVEGVVLQASIDQQLTDKDTELKGIQDELKGYKNKDYNFKKFRDMTDDERSKLSERETELIQRTEKLEADQSSFTERVIEGHKNDALAVLGGDDKDLRDKILFHFDRLKDTAQTKDEVTSKMRDAYYMATGGKTDGIDPIARAAAHHTARGVAPKTGSKMTADQKDLASRFGINEDDLKKYSK